MFYINEYLYHDVNELQSVSVSVLVYPYIFSNGTMNSKCVQKDVFSK